MSWSCTVNGEPYTVAYNQADSLSEVAECAAYQHANATGGPKDGEAMVVEFTHRGEALKATVTPALVWRYRCAFESGK